MAKIRDRWDSGSTYEEFMGRWSRQLALPFVSWLRVPGGVHWLDVGCGTGALTNAICRLASPASVLGCDPAAPYIDHARRQSREARASFVVAGAGSLPRRADGFGSVTSLLALNFLPDPEAAIDEMRTLTAPGGTVSACVWDYAGRMEFLRYFWDAAVALDSTARALDEGERFPICRPDALADMFAAAGLGGITHASIEIRTEFASFDDFWRPFLGGPGPAPSYVASLDADRRTALARHLQSALPRGAGGTVPLVALAWAVRGTVN